MALFKRKIDLNTDIATGFGANSENSAGRFFNRQTGGANIHQHGIGLLNRLSWYHTMLALPRWKFWLFLLLMFILINLLFATIYFLIGIEHLGGVIAGTPLENFLETFFFSCQTFTTVGYGRINPQGILVSSIAAFEAFLGLLGFALATGLLFGRFSRPQAFLKYSHNAIISPYKNGIAFMFRMAPFKNNRLSDAEVKLTLAMQVEENGKLANKFYPLATEISKINALNLSWTIVHAINEKSPLNGFNLQDMLNARAEVLVFVKAFDEVYSNTVISRMSYIAEEIVWGAKFRIMYHPSKDKKATILELNRINDFELVDLPVINSST
jgi:inward rectifier potassium channel